MKITPTHVYFWGSYLSNWYECSFLLENARFNCAEQYFMWKKAETFGDIQIANHILLETSPKEQKKLGKMVKRFDNDTWTMRRYKVMYDGVYAKFSQHEEFKRQLIDTDSKIIVEASPVDTIWGVGLAEDNPAILDETNWKGLNLLGKVLIEVRDNLKK